MGALLLAGGDQVIRMRLKEMRTLVMVRVLTGSGGAGKEGCHKKTSTQRVAK